MEERTAEAARGAKDKALVLTGYVDATYIYNFGPGTATSAIDFATDTIPKGDLNLSALWLRLEKPLSRGNSVEAGFQTGFMLGEDATLYAAAGSANVSQAGRTATPFMWERRSLSSGCLRQRWRCGWVSFKG